MITINLILDILEIKIHVSSESGRKDNPNNTPISIKTIFDSPTILDQNKS